MGLLIEAYTYQQVISPQLGTVPSHLAHLSKLDAPAFGFAISHPRKWLLLGIFPLSSSSFIGTS